MKLSIRKTRGGVLIGAPLLSALVLYRHDFWRLAFQSYDSPRAKYVQTGAVFLSVF